jgi:hypothetical protein
MWPAVAPLIQRGLDEGSNYTLAEIRNGLLRADMQLWTAISGGKTVAALVTSIQNKGNRRWCLLLAIGGECMDEWVDALSSLEDWARLKGCQEMRIYGRIGWARKLGYDIEWTKMSRKL